MELNRPFATVTPTLDGDVLSVLAQHDVTFTTGQIHRILGHSSEEGIRKVLRRLARQGIVLAGRVGHAYAYRLNTEHVAAEPIRALARLPATLLARLERHFAMWQHPPAYAAVFGSAAQGTMTVDSDLDLILVKDPASDEEVWERQVNELAEAVSRWTGNDARAIEYTTTELSAARHEAVLQDVLDHGLTVAGSRAWLLKQLRSIENV
jgi:predicted nucleotidyltransferase